MVQVDGPFWNQADGQKWAPVDAPVAEGGDYTAPVLYREVTIRVSEVLRDDFGILTSDVVTIEALGAGPDGADENAYIGGHFAVGDEVLLFLSNQVFYLREGPVVALQPFSFAEGVYHVVGGQVVPDHLYPGVAPSARSPDDQDEVVVSSQGVALAEFEARVVAARQTVDQAWEAYRPAAGEAFDLVRLIERDIGS